MHTYMNICNATFSTCLFYFFFGCRLGEKGGGEGGDVCARGGGSPGKKKKKGGASK